MRIVKGPKLDELQRDYEDFCTQPPEGDNYDSTWWPVSLLDESGALTGTFMTITEGRSFNNDKPSVIIGSFSDTKAPPTAFSYWLRRRQNFRAAAYNPTTGSGEVAMLPQPRFVRFWLWAAWMKATGRGSMG